MIKIGIPTNLRDKRFGTHGNYIEWVAQFGQPILLTPGVNQVDQIDALFLPGGKDVRNISFLNGSSDPHLEWFDDSYIYRMIEQKKPIFGVCRGMQTLNTFFGGTLRNLYGKELAEHNQNQTEEIKNSLVHKADIKHEEFKKENSSFSTFDPFINEIDVNSIHHQVIDKLAPGFEVIVKQNKVIEAIKHDTYLIAGVQWHPEKINDELSKQLFKSILKT